MLDLAAPLALLASVVVAALSLERIVKILAAESERWAEAWMYYTRGRAGILDMPEPPETGHPLRDRFETWIRQVDWQNEEQRDYVRELWEIAHRVNQEPTIRDRALVELREWGAPVKA